MRMRPLRLTAAAMLLALCGCAEMAGIPPSTGAGAAGAAAEVSQGSEQNGRFLTFVGPRRQYGEAFLGVPGTNYFALRSLLDTRNGEVRHQLYVEDSYSGAKREYDAARDGQGNGLQFVPISMNEITCSSGCSYAEEFSAVLPDALLRAHPGGLSVVFTAKAGPELAVAVRGDLLEKQLAAVDAARAGLPTAAAAPPASPPP